ncbi:MAG: fluoride efflux transporter CrcB [Acidobacteriota bacterium]
MARFLWICLGGAAGTGARYLVSLWAAGAFGTNFPIGTLLVNVIGSFLLTFVMYVAGTTGVMGEDLRLALTAGVFGGFTTYSTFNYETTQLFRTGAWATGSLNLAVTVLGCLLSGLAGFALARLVVGR